MKRRAKTDFKPLVTSAKTVELLDGKGGFCAERFGYTETEDGLEPSYAVAPLEKNVGVANVFFTQELPEFGYELILNRGGQFFKWNTGELNTIKPYGMLSTTYSFVVPYTVGAVCAYAVFSGKKLCVFKEDGQQIYNLSYKLTGGAFYCGRVFAIDVDDPFVVRWSAYSITEWQDGLDAGGFLRLNPHFGKPLCITLLGDRLVILRRFGITVLHAFGDARHFRLEQGIDVMLPEVADKTALACRGKLWFFTKEGLCAYDGVTVKNVKLDFFGKKYTYELAKLRFGRYIFAVLNDGGTRCIMEYDTVSGAYSLFARGSAQPFFLGEELYCFTGSVINGLVRGGSDENRIWKSKPLDLSSDRVKTLKYLYIESGGTVNATVECDGRTRRLAGTGKIYVGECGRIFTVSVNGTDKITRIAVELEVRA